MNISQLRKNFNINPVSLGSVAFLLNYLIPYSLFRIYLYVNIWLNDNVFQLTCLSYDRPQTTYISIYFSGTGSLSIFSIPHLTTIYSTFCPKQTTRSVFDIFKPFSSMFKSNWMATATRIGTTKSNLCLITHSHSITVNYDNVKELSSAWNGIVVPPSTLVMVKKKNVSVICLTHASQTLPLPLFVNHPLSAFF